MIKIEALELLIGPRRQESSPGGDCEGSRGSFPLPTPGRAETGGKAVLSQLWNANVIGSAEDAESVQKPHHDRKDRKSVV